ncbi:hypothetical protein FOMPIDRAFT_1056386 [Fomitopsis schrenkii]|uniref:Uncharacterized protein n=1 Tax=Fomitopsis schrenkii TaxID=2126942 RepID=S8DHG6_FOMSC|nr:hypothetical protein FOMPIDRAFT_1056386 [Fomitopsis schrenkii]
MSLITQTYSTSTFSAVPSAGVVSSTASADSPVATYGLDGPWFPNASLQSSFMNSVTAGLFMGAVLLGVHTITLGHALVSAWHRKAARDRWLLLAVPSALWFASLIYEICSIVFTNQAWEAGQEGINSRTPFRYFWNNSNPDLTLASAAALLVSTVIADGFLCVRTVALWKTLWVSIPLVLVTLFAYGWDVVQVVYIANESNEGLLAIPYESTFIAPVITAQSLHAIFAILLVSRVATADHKTETRRISAKKWLIETVLPYALISVLFMGTYCGSSVAANVFLPMLVQTQGITIDLLIAHRKRRDGFLAVEPEDAASATMQLPAPVQAPSTTSGMSDTEKLTLAVMASKWEYGLDKKEPLPPQYSESA